MSQIEMTEDDFVKQYRPKRNHIDLNASWEGRLFETYGAELEYVQLINESAPTTVWTQVSDDEGDLVIVNGYHYVNRMGYLITEVNFDPDTDIVVVDPDIYDCRYCQRPKQDCEKAPCDEQRQAAGDDDSGQLVDG